LNKLILPNAITSLNILSGTTAIYFALTYPEELYIAGFCILIASVFDFLDGFVARALKAQSEFGKQLDSLSDVVSFGLAPTFIMLKILQNSTQNKFLPFISFIIIIFSAVRLAIFNISSQKNEFKGLPTPAFALLIAAIAISQKFPDNIFNISLVQYWLNTFVLLAIVIIFSILLVSKIPMLALKFQNYSFKDNKKKYFFIIISLFLLSFFFWSGIIFIIFFYVLMSLINMFFNIKY
jgi:CDP-diacylglycerol--serine O-phosphatidyltransferase